MNRPEAVAYVHAQVVLAQADLEEMLAENRTAEMNGCYPVNGADSFKAWRERWEPVISHNAVVGLFRAAEYQ